MPPSNGCAVGALLLPKPHAQSVLRSLPLGWKKRGVPVATVEGNLLAVALSPEAARIFDLHNSPEVPPLIAALIASGEVRWASGMRFGGHITPSAPNEAPSGVFTFLELFAGLGGFRIGLEAIGGACVFASEIDPLAASAYARNFGDAHLYGDITEVPTEAIPPHDILTGGFPCQSFSRTGDGEGLSDARGDLFHEIIRCARARRPKAMMLENVPNLLRVDDGHAIHTIASSLTAIGYHVRVQLLNATATTPQHRERLFIVAFRADLADAAQRFAWPTFDPTSRTHATLRDALEDTIPPAEMERYRLTPSQWSLIRASHDYLKCAEWRLAQPEGFARTLRGSYRKSFARFSEFVPLDADGRVRAPQTTNAGGSRAQPTDAAHGGHDDEGAACADEGGEAGDDGGPAPQLRARSKPTPAVDCTDDLAGATIEAGDSSAAEIPPAPRFYTERECARLQGFPESYVFEGGKQYVQLGNAVNAKLVEAVGRCILDALNGDGGGTPAVPAEPATAQSVAASSATARAVAADLGGRRRCEDFLCAASINLLRRVTPPDRAAPPSHADTPDDSYGRYGDEDAAERRHKALARRPDQLFCCRCLTTFSLTAAVCHDAPSEPPPPSAPPSPGGGGCLGGVDGQGGGASRHVQQAPGLER